MKTMKSRFSRACDNFCQTRKVGLDLRLRTDSVAGTILRAVPNVDSLRRKNDGIRGDACYKTEYINRPDDALSMELGRQKLSRARSAFYVGMATIVCDPRSRTHQNFFDPEFHSFFINPGCQSQILRFANRCRDAGNLMIQRTVATANGRGTTAVDSR